MYAYKVYYSLINTYWYIDRYIDWDSYIDKNIQNIFL